MATYSEAAKLRWKNVPVEERSRRMSLLAKVRHAKMTKKQRTAFARLIRKGRKNKK